MLPDKKTLIYVLKDPLTYEVRYVGKTTLPLSYRLTDHVSTGKKPTNYRTFWIKSILKQGLRPLIEELDSCVWEESQQLEIDYIREYRLLGYNLVNLSDGGEGSLGVKRSQESKNKQLEATLKRSKPVYRYTLVGTYIDSFLSCYHAALFIKGRRENISQCCRVMKKSHKGFIWSYLTPDKFDVTSYIHEVRVTVATENNNFIKKQRKVVVTNLVTQEEKVTNSLKEASEFTGISKPGICCECKGLRKTVGNYTFKYYGTN